MMKSLLLGLLTLGVLASPSMAGGEPERRYSPAIEQFTMSGYAMPLLPRRFQNHCGFYYGHFICLDHCGLDYQVYYCAKGASGCCHPGQGYCDGVGHLHCGPGV
jgi:hypothetical protein